MSRNRNRSSSSGRLTAFGRSEDDELEPLGAGTLVPSLVTAGFLALVPLAALAHEGRHDRMGLVQAARRLLTQPHHLAMLAMLVALLAYGGWRVDRSRMLR